MNTTNPRKPAIPVRRRIPLRGTAIAFLLALSAFFGWRGYQDSSSSVDLPQAQAASASVSTPALDTIPIEQIRVGQRVLTNGAPPDQTLPTAVDEHTWRHLTFEQTDTWPDGTIDRICVESLMPPDWLAFHDGAPVGSTVPIPLDLEEMGLPEGMTAQVVANNRCPPIDQGPGRVVLTTVNHLNPQVVELTLRPVAPQYSLPSAARGRAGEGADAGHVLPSSSNHAVASTPQATNGSGPLQPSGSSNQETVRPTAHHKFFSETRAQWLSAEDLQPGERLRGLTGPLEVVSQRPIPGTHRVYNMTVEGEHVYHVSTLGVLAHYNCNFVPIEDLQASAARLKAPVKTPPNPYGKLGSPAHRAKVAEVSEGIRSRGLVPRTEVSVRTVNGQKATRVMDVVAVDPKTCRIVEVHQVGKSLKSNPKIPVARERAALRDVRHSPEIRGAERHFHEY